MEKFIYKKSAGVTVLSASMTEFVYKRHSHEEYALGVTLRGIQQYHTDGRLCSSHQNGVMLFNPEQAHDGSAADKDGIDYVMIYIPIELLSEISGSRRSAGMTNFPPCNLSKPKHSKTSSTGFAVSRFDS